MISAFRDSYGTWSQCIPSSVALIFPPFSILVSVARPRGARHAWRMLYMWWSVIAVENGPVRALEIPAGCSRSSPDVRKLTSFQRELVKTWFFAWRTRWHADRRSIEPASEATRNLSGSGCDLVLRFHALVSFMARANFLASETSDVRRYLWTHARGPRR